MQSRKKKIKPSKVVVAVTGFGSFKGVAANPTEVLVKSLLQHLKGNKLPKTVAVDRASVLEVSGEGCKESLQGIRDSCFLLQGQHRVWLHFGVDAKSNCFKLERKAWNEADFRCADERGWQPQKETIYAEDGPLNKALLSDLPVSSMLRRLRRQGFNVKSSTDPGRFVCNWIYYISLRWAKGASTNQDGSPCEDSLFVHVPPFSEVPREKQMEFCHALLSCLGECMCT